ncbi:MAG: heparinase, partial [Bacteroidales bacterium]|nr:heparinase [Bacteroidales bacterium]
NAKALIFAGIFFEGKEADKWIEKGLSILNKEIPEQILQDGGNYERSPMYHCIMLEDMLDLICIAQSSRYPLLSFDKISEWKEITCKMLYWLNAMCHSDSQISLFNDAAIGIAPEYEQLSNYAEKLGIKTSQQPSVLTDLKESGYISYKNEDFMLIIDAGNIGPDYQPGHAHADTLSFELSSNQKRIIVDSGTSCYGTGTERLRQRSTEAHNTISIDDLDSSEVWGGFRVARRAKINERKIEKKENSIVIRASHDGFNRRNKDLGNHIRTWTIENRRITIIDTIEGKGKHHIKANLHFHPEIELVLNNQIITALYSENPACKLFLDETMEVMIEDSTYHPQFGVSIRNRKIVIKKDTVLPFTFKTIIEI